MNDKVGGNFFPTQDSMRKFLIKFYNIEGAKLYNKIYNIEYRADDLFRNFNDGIRNMEQIHRDKITLEEEFINDGQSMQTLPCGHNISYAAYIDNDNCALCDKLNIKKVFENGF